VPINSGGKCVAPHCTGVDDTTTINLAIKNVSQATHGGVVFFPAGTCVVKTTTPVGPGFNVAVQLLPNVRLIGAAAVGAGESILRLADQSTGSQSSQDYWAIVSSILSRTASQQSTYADVSGAIVSGLTFDANSSHNPIDPTPFQTPACAPNVTSACPLEVNPRFSLDIGWGNDIQITQNTFENANGLNTLYVNGLHDRVTVTNNVFAGIGQNSPPHDHSSIYVTSRNVDALGNVFGTTEIAHNQMTGAGVAATTAIETHGSYTNVHDNTVTSYQKGFNIGGANTTSSMMIDVSYNHVKNGQIGIDLWSWDQGGALLPDLTTVNVHDNDIVLDVAGSRALWPCSPVVGISLEPDIQLDSGFVASPFSDLELRNNHIMYAPYDPSSLNPPQCTTPGGVNTMVDESSAGIWLFRDARFAAMTDRSLTIAGNCIAPVAYDGTGNPYCDLSSTAPGAPSAGVYVYLNDGSLVDLTIQGNTIRNPSMLKSRGGIELWSWNDAAEKGSGRFTGTVAIDSNAIQSVAGAAPCGILASNADVSQATSAAASMDTYVGTGTLLCPPQAGLGAFTP
jgi:hypothetical protein